MTKIKNHADIKRMRIKFMVEGVALILFTAVYYDGFDGHAKPLWANILLIGSAIAYVLTRILGWHALRNPIRANNLKKSLETLHIRLKHIAISNTIASISFAVALILFFSSIIVFTREKYGMLLGMIITLGAVLLFSRRNWIRQIKAIKRTLEEFQEFS
ncbi:hypothetical protein [Spongiimicrobium salis]|uniref:hypothetical protein n=1 Tax=Spongiimicrobium salis TaxID=1667022 RepID=UPI00374D7A3E